MSKRPGSADAAALTTAAITAKSRAAPSVFILQNLVHGIDSRLERSLPALSNDPGLMMTDQQVRLLTHSLTHSLHFRCFIASFVANIRDRARSLPPASRRRLPQSRSPLSGLSIGVDRPTGRPTVRPSGGGGGGGGPSFLVVVVLFLITIDAIEETERRGAGRRSRSLVLGIDDKQVTRKRTLKKVSSAAGSHSKSPTHSFIHSFFHSLTHTRHTHRRTASFLINCLYLVRVVGKWGGERERERERETGGRLRSVVPKLSGERNLRIGQALTLYVHRRRMNNVIVIRELA